MRGHLTLSLSCAPQAVHRIFAVKIAWTVNGLKMRSVGAYIYITISFFWFINIYSHTLGSTDTDITDHVVLDCSYVVLSLILLSYTTVQLLCVRFRLFCLCDVWRKISCHCSFLHKPLTVKILMLRFYCTTKTFFFEIQHIFFFISTTS